MQDQTSPNPGAAAPTSRRSFLATASAASVGTAVASLPIAASARVAGSDEIKIGLIGAGGRGSGAASQALTVGGCRLVAVADAFEDRLNGAINNLRQNHADAVDVPDNRRHVGFDGYKEVIDACDMVILTTPPGFRPMHFAAAVEAGKHVFMEKPVSVDSAGTRKVLEAARQADEKGLRVVVGLQRRYDKSYIETLEQYKEGIVGRLTSGQVYWNGSGVWVRDRNPNWTEMEYQMRNWYYFNWLCGDHIVEQHIHNIDVANWFLDAYPVSAQGMGGREVRTDKKFGEIYDHHYVEFRYADGTIINSQCRHQPNTHNQVREELVAEGGKIHQGRITDHAGQNLWRHRNQGNPNPYQAEHNVLQEHIREGKPLNDAYHGAYSSFTAVLGRYATYSGRQLNFEEALAADVDLMPEKFSFDADPPVLPDENGEYAIAVPGQFMPW